MSEGKAIELRVSHSIEELETLFIDLVQVEANPEAVFLTLIQKLPGENQEDDTQPNAKIIGRFAVSWPHFARLADLFQRIISERYIEVKDHLAKTLVPSMQNN